MVEETMDSNEARPPWQRIARLLLNARALVLTQGAGVIVKWDGQRDTRNIHTLVVEGDADSGPRFRTDTDDLERALAQAFPLDTDTEFESTTCIAELLAEVDSAARRHLVVSLRMIRSEGAVNDEVAILGQGNKGLIFNRQSENLAMVLGEAVSFLKKESLAYVPPH